MIILCYYYSRVIKMNEVTKVLCERRSVRKFKNEQIPRDILDEILKCGTFAPSGKNMQNGIIVVIENKKYKNSCSAK